MDIIGIKNIHVPVVDIFIPSFTKIMPYTEYSFMIKMTESMSTQS